MGKPRLTGGLRSIDQSGCGCQWLGTDEVKPPVKEMKKRMSCDILGAV